MSGIYDPGDAEADYDDDSDFSHDDYEDDYGDCGMTRDGQCMKAGAEECDWECPVMSRMIRENAQRELKRKAKTR